MSADSPSTHVYDGSCHCGAIKYKLRLTFPPIPDPKTESIRTYKCNCTTCLKMGLFHCPPVEPSEDFILLSPSNPSDMGDYRCNTKNNAWYFCKTCGVRPLGMGGEWEQAELDVDKWAGKSDAAGNLTKVWKVKGGEWVRNDGQKRVNAYMSINAVTLEAGQEGLNLKEEHEKGLISYFEARESPEQLRLGEPYPGGIY